MPDIKFQGRVAQIQILLGDAEVDGVMVPCAIFQGVLIDPPAAADLPPSQTPMKDWEAKHLAAKALMLQFGPEGEEMAKHPRLLIAKGGMAGS